MVAERARRRGFRVGVEVGHGTASTLRVLALAADPDLVAVAWRGDRLALLLDAGMSNLGELLPVGKR